MTGTRGRPRLHRVRSNGVVCALLVAASVVVPLGQRVGATGVDDKLREAEAIADELERLSEQMDTLGEDYVEAISKQEELGIEVEQAKLQVSENEAKLAQMRGTLYTAAVSQFMNGGRNSTLTNLLTSTGGVQDALQRQELTAIALNTGAMTTDSLGSLSTELNKQRKQLEKKQEQAKNLADTVLKRQGAAESLASRYQDRLGSVQGELAVLLRQVRERRNAQALEEARRIAAGYESKYSSTQSKYKNIPKVSARAQTAINAALGQLGVKYQYARSEPGVAFDCSGLTSYAWGRAGVGLQRSSRTQYASLPKIPTELAAPGDLVFTGSPIHHVGIYLGGGQMVHAPQTGDVVKVSPVRWYKVVGVVRPG